jgi:transcriptional regulator with XRE-family HTH domain/tetratricopeptide (TPR) repeat protein
MAGPLRSINARTPSLGKTLRDIRRARGLTQRALARAAHVDDSYISQLERDYRSPSPRALENLARALGVGVAELLGSPSAPPGFGAAETFVGREAELAAFDAWLAGRDGLLLILGPPGVGKTAFLTERIIPRCRDARLAVAYGAGRHLTSYRDFLKTVRDAFAGRAAPYHAFDEIFEQSRALERRLRSRVQDPFSVTMETGAAPAAGEGGVELSYAEKRVLRDAEALLTEELLAAWGNDAALPAVIILDDVDAVSATVGYWLKRFFARLAETASWGERRRVILVANRPVSLVGAARDAAPPALRLAPFTAAEVEAYLRARALDLQAADRAVVAGLGGHVRALKLWGDYFAAAASYAHNRFGAAEDALRRLEDELAAAPADEPFPERARLQLKTQQLLGHLTRLQGRLEEAAAFYGAAAAAAVSPAPSAEVGYVFLDLGHTERHRGRWDEAAAYYARANDVFRAVDEALGAGIAHASLGTVYRLQAKFARAKQEYRRAAEILRRLSDEPAAAAEARRWLASTLSNDAIAARLEAERAAARGDEAAAHRLLQRARRLCEEAMAGAGDAAERAVAENRLGLCLVTAGRWLRAAGRDAEAAEALAQADRYYRRALAAFEDLGDKYRVAQVLADLGTAAAEQGLVHDAIIHYKNALALFQQLGSRYHGAKVLVQLGGLAEGDEQLSYFAEALTSAREHNDASLTEIAAAVRAFLDAGDAARARAFFEEMAADAVIAERLARAA